MTHTDKRLKFREYLNGSRCMIPASVYDPMSARLAESVGYEIGMFAGSVASLAVLGAPDLIVLTLTELAEQARRITRASRLPILVDADHGFGNALNVKRTVEELENAGIAALTIEDTDLPQPFGSDGKPSLISIEEGTGKMQAALAGRSDPSLVVVGRTSAVSISGLQDAITRCQAYEAAGVDAVFLTGIKTREELEAVCGSVKIPVMLGLIGKQINDLDYLAKAGVRVGLQGHLPIMASIQAAHDTYLALRGGKSPEELSGASSEVTRVATIDDAYKDWTRDFLGGAK
ncbi:isocitrate lyase/PEP mutase family protein [Ensifer adhaerens]|uniref:isocitrate lyase/PEP mutase family protein n=1 Tax=Ensifer adhaerens TaxID=106592 RepID=UPI0023A99208|nr:isocitrate lyase/PEP mutase family protein [Ensifer adhaerens]WDZ76224.1 isocitrate lyase/PEP mutase family protein [Ensifer adhaerens]